MKVGLDHLTIHNDDLGVIVGRWNGVPIKEWNPAKSDNRAQEFINRLSANSRVQTQGVQ